MKFKLENFELKLAEMKLSYNSEELMMSYFVIQMNILFQVSRQISLKLFCQYRLNFVGRLVALSHSTFEISYEGLKSDMTKDNLKKLLRVGPNDSDHNSYRS